MTESSDSKPEYHNSRNPLLPVEMHIADPEAHSMADGRVYVYGSWDQFDDGTYCSTAYRIVSSPNLADWTDHGISFSSSQVDWPLNTDTLKYPIQKHTHHRPVLLYAPDAIHRDGTYYLYFCTADGSEGVAVAEAPMGPFKNPVRFPCRGIDPAIFVDDDGQAYYYWGQFRASAARLKPNMVEIDPDGTVSQIMTEEEHWFHEGSSMRKRNGIYYYVYSCIKRGKPTCLAYAVSGSPLGPFEYRGIIIDNERCDPHSWNNHGSIEEVNGTWFVFYHRSSRNSNTRRRLCIEPIAFNSDGTIDEVPMTSQGAGDSFALGEEIDAFRTCEVCGSVFIGLAGAGDEVLTNIRAGDTAIFRYVRWEYPPNTIEIAAKGSGRIEIYLDAEAGAAGEIVLLHGTVVRSQFSGIAGRHEIIMKFIEADGLEISSFSFS